MRLIIKSFDEYRRAQYLAYDYQESIWYWSRRTADANVFRCSDSVDQIRKHLSLTPHNTFTATVNRHFSH